jgi:DNA-directed RNA polymerase subunit RPC12/RpoP
VSIEQIVGRLRNLPKYRDMDESDIRKLAIKEFYKSNKMSFDLDSLFADKEEIKVAKELQKKYLENYKIESVSEKNLLSQLIYLEVFHLRLQKSANAFDGQIGGVPSQLLDSIHKNINQIITLKDRLGIGRGEDGNDSYQVLETLKKKFKIWLSENQGSRTLNCPHCGQYIILKIRTEAWEAAKHPYFKDKLLGNNHLIKLYNEGKITQDDVSKILGTSPEYTLWLTEKWKLDKVNDN